MCVRPATMLRAGLVGGGCVSPTGNHASCGSSRRRAECERVCLRPATTLCAGLVGRE